MMNRLLSSCAGGLLFVAAGCSSAELPEVNRASSDARHVVEPTASESRISESEARRLFVAEERSRRGERSRVEPSRIEVRRPPAPAAQPVPGRITHADAYRNSRRVSDFAASDLDRSADEQDRAPIGFLEGTRDPESANTTPTRFLEIRDGEVAPARTFLDRPATDVGEPIRRGVTLPGRIEQLRGTSISARPGIFYDYVPTPEPGVSGRVN